MNIPLRWSKIGMVSLSWPDLWKACIFMSNIPRLIIAWRTHNLNGIEFDFICFIHCWSSYGMTCNIKMICSTCPIPIWVLLTNIEDVVSYKILDTSNANSGVMSQPCNWEGQKEKICLGGIICDEMAFHKHLFKVAFTCIITTGYRIYRQQHVCKWIISLVRININLKAPIHFLIVFLEDISIKEHLVVGGTVSWTKTKEYETKFKNFWFKKKKRIH